MPEHSTDALFLFTFVFKQALNFVCFEIFCNFALRFTKSRDVNELYLIFRIYLNASCIQLGIFGKLEKHSSSYQLMLTVD